VDASTIRKALKVGVTLDPVAEQLPSLADLVEAGLTDEAVDALAYNSISLADLELVVDVLTHPSELLHWLGRRGEIARKTWIAGDEMDLLGLHLRTGFNLRVQETAPSIHPSVRQTAPATAVAVAVAGTPSGSSSRGVGMDVCNSCGGERVRTGACSTCSSCGTTTGCG
jgi:hypothetical protein